MEDLVLAPVEKQGNDIPLDNTNIDIIKTKLSLENVDNKKQIPLEGTAVGEAVSGNIELENNVAFINETPTRRLKIFFSAGLLNIEITNLDTSAITNFIYDFQLGLFLDKYIEPTLDEALVPKKYVDDSITIESDPTGITGADQVTNVVSLTQAEYDAIGTPNASTFYVITD